MTPQAWAEALALPLFLIGALASRRRPLSAGAGNWAARLSRRPALSILIAFATGCVASAVPALLFGAPIPQSHDEFCYLLEARTFAAGRLTNPTPPLWRHFESPYLLFEPSYTAKYHPAQGLVLAAGFAAGGSAMAGVALQVGLFGAALLWALRRWIPARRAFLIALAATLWCGASTYWGYSFWGGCVPAAAGALVAGAARSLGRRPSVAHGVWMGVGLAGLALSRPFEGLFVGIVAAVWLIGAALRSRRPRKAWTSSAVVCGMVLVVAAAWLLHYNRTVTGDPWLPPYLHYTRTFDPTPILLWQTPRPVTPTPHVELQNYWRLAYEQWSVQRTPLGWLRAAWGSLRKLEWFFLGAALWLPLLALRLRYRAVRFAVGVVLAVLAAVLSISFCVPHYFAPATGAVAILVAVGLSALRRWRPRGRPWGARLAAGCIAATIGVLPLGTLALGQARAEGWGIARDEIERRLRAQPGADLVFVRFGPSMIDPGWVYNEPELEQAGIVWARSTGETDDCALIARLAGRRVWTLALRDVELPTLIERDPGGCLPH